MRKGNCKICSNGIRAIYDRQFNLNYYHCSRCGFIAMDPGGILSREKEKARYLDHINTPGDPGYVAMLQTFLEKSVFPFHASITTALDFGSGPGPVLADILREKGCAVDIYDPYFAPEPVYKNKAYSLITCTEVLEHLEHPLETLQMLKGHLAPTGVLAVMTLFHPVDGTAEGDAAFKKWWYRRDPTHISFFRPETFRYIAGELGLALLMCDNRNTLSFRLPVS